jgi:hypothetical protein
MKWIAWCLVSALAGCAPPPPKPSSPLPEDIAIKVTDNDQAAARDEAERHCKPYHAFMYRLGIEDSNVIARFRCER